MSILDDIYTGGTAVFPFFNPSKTAQDYSFLQKPLNNGLKAIMPNLGLGGNGAGAAGASAGIASALAMKNKQALTPGAIQTPVNQAAFQAGQTRGQTPLTYTSGGLAQGSNPQAMSPIQPVNGSMSLAPSASMNQQSPVNNTIAQALLQAQQAQAGQ